MKTVAVLGPGGVGGLVAAALARAGTPTTVVAREETAARLLRDGLRVQSVRMGDFQVDVRAVPRLTEPVDLLIVATKATGLREAMERIETAPRLVLPLLNGLDHLTVLRERWPDRVCAGVIRVESDRPEAGLIVQTSPFLRIDLAPDTPDTEAAAHLLRGAEIPAKVNFSEPDVMWRKLVRLNALACTTTAFAEPLGAIRAHPRHRLALEGAVTETAAVAQAEGAYVDAGEVLTELAEAHAELTSSMARDVANGNEPELDAIPGAVLRAAARHGLECPTVAELVQAIRDRLD
ncbi:MAG: 2-dehydropantoate 2-reductase [Solirubrobacteraceae bacterium]|nr:2-dehydropantoate 2-reductase [Solirubrobacteraceae bacterium]